MLTIRRYGQAAEFRVPKKVFDGGCGLYVYGNQCQGRNHGNAQDCEMHFLLRVPADVFLGQEIR